LNHIASAIGTGTRVEIAPGTKRVNISASALYFLAAEIISLYACFNSSGSPF